jgi:hypothetical protein
VDDESFVAQLVIERAQTRLDRQFDDNDALDAKALGVLGADAAGVGVLVAVHDAISKYWPVPAFALAASAVLLLYLLYPRDLDSGPNWRQYFEKFGGAEPLEAGLQMLSELLVAVEANNAKAPMKSTMFKAGFIVMGLGLLGALVVALVR